MTDEVIRALFEGASDFEARQLRSGPQALYAYYIDGLTSGGDISEYIFKPVSENLPEDIRRAYDMALHGGVYMATVRECGDLDDVAQKLVNGFCVILFPGVGALAFEARTGVGRGRGHR